VKQDKKNPGPSDQQFTKLKNPIHKRSKLPANKGSAGADQQFNKGESYDSDDGSGGSASIDSHPGSISGVGSADHSDAQFDSHLQDNKGKTGKLKKNTPGDDMNFNGQDISPAKMIMRAVGKAANSDGGGIANYQGNKKVSSPKSKSQTKSNKNTTSVNEQSRPKSQTTQSYTPKAPESKKGSKT